MKYGNAEAKYHNKKIRHGDEVFDSQHELHRWLELILLQRAGKITDLRRQLHIRHRRSRRDSERICRDAQKQKRTQLQARACLRGGY